MKITFPSLVFLILCFSFQAVLGSTNLTEAESVQRVRINFISPSGNIRPLLLGFTPDDAATDGVDYGYDAKNMDNYPNDLNWIINDERYVIQGVGSYNPSKFYEFGLYLEETGIVTIALTALENFNTEIPVYVYDAEFDDYTQINDTSFVRSIQPGTYRNRFYLAFSTENVVLSNEQNKFEDNIKITHKNGEVQFNFNNNSSSKKISIHSLDGKQLYANVTVERNSGIPSSDLVNIPLLISVNIDNLRLEKIIIIPQ